MEQPAISVGPATDVEAFVQTDHVVWFGEVGSLSTAEHVLGVPEDQRFAAGDPRATGTGPATYQGIYGVRPLTLSVPGVGEKVRRVPCAGLTWVGVHPDHRRRGVLTAMMRDHLERVRDEPGTHVSALHASEPAIYGRYGYGLASQELTVTLGRGTTLRAPQLDESAAGLHTELATASDPGMAERVRACWEHCAETAVGTVVAEREFYEEGLRETPEGLRGKESVRLLFARRGEQDVGFAAFQREHKWEHARPGGELTVHTLAGEPVARLVLLRRLVDFDLMGTVKVGRAGADDPLFHWVGGPRSTGNVETYDSLWVRLVDLPEALAARGYADPCDVVLEVEDATAPWNAGRWRFGVDAKGAGTAERTDAEPDLRLPVEYLGAAYLGGVSPVSLARAGLLEELRPGAARELWHALRTDVLPDPAIGF